MSTELWTTNLTEIRRQDDAERIGFLAPSGGLWAPLNLLGIPLADPSDREQAESTVRERAMSSIVEPYWCRIPRPLTQPRTDARTVDQTEWWDQVLVVEVTERVATLEPKFVMESEQSCLITVSLPASDVLFRNQPADQGMFAGS